jgi:hypothetical protein
MRASIGLCLAFALASIGCPSIEEPVPDCIPSEASFDTNVKPLIEEHCVRCHGAEPDFGAPISLLEYEPLIAGLEGERPVDRMVTHLVEGTMPPEGNPQPEHADYDTMIGWASCGADHPHYGAGLEASQPVWVAPEDPPVGAIPIELTSEGYLVALDAIDDYQYFTFADVVAEDMFIRRIEPVIDESRVLHHITFNNLATQEFLYTWAPGTGAIEFPDGGLRIRPTDQFFINTHYNNGAGIEDAYDSSGVRLWVTPPEGTEWVMLAPQTWEISVPAKSTSESTAECTVTEPFEVIAGMPHMHEIGSEFRHTVERVDGSIETLIELTGWSFELQFFYAMNMQLNAGDHMSMTCVFDNDKDFVVRGGQGTTDEMCFDFMYVTPPSAAGQCGEQ